jgi:hypothetical protein
VHFLRWHYATHTQPAGGALKAGVSPKIISERIGPNTDAGLNHGLNHPGFDAGLMPV